MIAHKLGMSLQRCKCETTSSEFVGWQVYFNEERNHFHRMDYYLAHLTATVDRQNAKYPKSVRAKDYLLKFATGKKTEPIKDPEMRQRVSKSWWRSLFSGSK